MKKSSIIGFVLSFMLFVSAGFAQDQEMDSQTAKYYNAGTELLKSDSLKAAVVMFDSALATSKDYRIYYQKGVAYKRLEDYDKSLEAFNAAINANPGFAGTYLAIASVYYVKDNMNKAIESYNKVLELNDSSLVPSAKKALALSYYKLGATAISAKKYKDAVTNLQKSVEYDSLDRAFLSLAKAYSELKKYDETLAAAENALKYQSAISKAAPYYYIGLAYKGKGNTAKAKEAFTEAKADATYKKAAEYELANLK